MRYHKNFSPITFQHMYANLLSSKITQHDKFTQAGNFTEIFSSETVIDTNNIFAIKRQETLPISVACMQTKHTITKYAIK